MAWIGLFVVVMGIATKLLKHAFAKTGYPEKQLVPSMLAMDPIVSLFSISAYRISHYLHRSALNL